MAQQGEFEYPVLQVIQERWSPRAFADRLVEPEKLRSLFEAARWAASSYNEQPWRFVLATKDDPAAFEKVLSCLVEVNQSWAKNAPALMITFVSEKFAKNGSPNRVCENDLGLAMGNLSLQATALGLVVHQMAGIDTDKADELFNAPADFHAMTACAIGYEGEPESLEQDWMIEAEKSPRSRRPFKEFVFNAEGFGVGSSLFD